MADQFFISTHPGLNFDSNVVDQKTIPKTFGQLEDVVELHIYDENNNLIQSDLNFIDYEKLPGQDHELKIHPEKILNDRGYLSGTYVIKLSFQRNKIFNDSKLLEKTGVFSIVLECVESTLAKKISKKLKIPTIGIGSSKFCDGQILVIDDLIGLNETKVKFVKKFGQIKKNISTAAKNFSKEVKNKKYPSKRYSY